MFFFKASNESCAFTVHHLVFTLDVVLVTLAFTFCFSSRHQMGLWMVNCTQYSAASFYGRFCIAPEPFCFLKTHAVTAPKEWLSSNINGYSNRCGDQCPPIYHTHREKERSKTKIKPRKLKDSNHKSKLRSNKIKRFKTHYKPKY